MKEAEAFSPGHITGFFQICDQPDDPLLKGSRGAGVSITQGVKTRVHAEKSAKTSIKIVVNGDPTRSASASEHVANTFLSLAGESHRVVVEHEVEVPIGQGFGSSGAGALSSALALNEVFDLNLSRFEVAQIAHVAEVECKTGLGTVIAETYGGLEIRVKPGAPGVGEIQYIPINHRYVVTYLSLGPLFTKEILTDEVLRERINRFGGSLVDELIEHATPSAFMLLSRRFSEHMGLVSERLQAVLEETASAGLPSSMAMLGETVFSIAKQDQVGELHRIFSNHASSESSMNVANIDFKGARIT